MFWRYLIYQIDNLNVWEVANDRLEISKVILSMFRILFVKLRRIWVEEINISCFLGVLNYSKNIYIYYKQSRKMFHIIIHLFLPSFYRNIWWWLLDDVLFRSLSLDEYETNAALIQSLISKDFHLHSTPRDAYLVSSKQYLVGFFVSLCFFILICRFCNHFYGIIAVR